MAARNIWPSSTFSAKCHFSEKKKHGTHLKSAVNWLWKNAVVNELMGN